MNGGIRSIAQVLALELAPATLFGASVAFAALRAGGQPLAIAASAGAAALLLAWVGLRRIGKDQPSLELPAFELDRIPEAENADIIHVEDAVACEAVSPDPSPSVSPDELLLDDVLADLPSDSRVVRLFASAPVPTAGELQARIDRHLRGERLPSAPPDATHELHEALDALRRSLR